MHHGQGGANSWCFDQRALAKDEEPGSHRQNMHTLLSWEVASHVKASVSLTPADLVPKSGDKCNCYSRRMVGH